MTSDRRGLYGKYTITKTDGSPVDLDARYFVLRYDNDQCARVALAAYAKAASRAGMTKLAEDIAVELMETSGVDAKDLGIVLGVSFEPDPRRRT